MDDAVTKELIYEALKKIQAQCDEINRSVSGHDKQLMEFRRLLISMQANNARREAAVAGMRADVDAIKRHLDVNGDPAWQELKSLLDARISEGLAGKVSSKSIKDIINEELAEAGGSAPEGRE